MLNRLVNLYAKNLSASDNSYKEAYVGAEQLINLEIKNKLFISSAGIQWL